MPEQHFTFQSYAWSLGTTSFRMADFHRKVEEQLLIIDDFWNKPETKGQNWKANSALQSMYYDFAFERGFITGNLDDDNAKKAKTARQKTSGLVDIGLIDDNRHLTQVGLKLLKMAKSGDFAPDNDFQIPSDSYLYLKQILKTSSLLGEGYVRPFLVTGKLLLACDGYLTDEEFTYLLPLCASSDITNAIISQIRLLREGKTEITQIIIDTVLNRYNYPYAMDYLVKSDKTDEDIMIVGMNRDGIRHDAAYAKLYRAMSKVFLEKDYDAVPNLYQVSKTIKNKPGTLWRGHLFENPRAVRSAEDLSNNEFMSVSNANQMASNFFIRMHLYKIMATLADYRDLNRRYLKITDAFIFDDGKVVFSPIFEYYFKTAAGSIFDSAYNASELLTEDCDLSDIDECLLFDENAILGIFNRENNTHFTNIADLYLHIEKGRYQRFRNLIDTQFPNDVLISMLEKCETRKADSDLIGLTGGEADVPTIFEYIVAISWYRISNYHGKILDYMNMSLDVNLLPRTHAGGGESDIVYIYSGTDEYPSHTLLIECTLMEGTTQRHGEMEPVSRHLSNYMIDEDENAYCTFVANNLHASVVSDFRNRKNSPYYRNDIEHVDGMKILPLHTRELRQLLAKNIKYGQIYKLFEEAYQDESIKSPPEWYMNCIKGKIEQL